MTCWNTRKHFAGNAGLPLLLLYAAACLAAILPLRRSLFTRELDGMFGGVSTCLSGCFFR